MHKIKQLLFSTLFWVSIVPASFANEGTITLVADEWCPYNCAQDAEKPGYMVEIVRKALSKSGISVEYKVLPWTQAVEGVRKGEYDALVGASHGDAPDFIFPEVLQGISLNKFWVRNDSNWNFKNLDSLNDQRFGIIDGYSYGQAIDPYIKTQRASGTDRISVISGDSASKQNIEKLLSGKIDVILEDENVIRYYFNSRNLPLPLKQAGNPVKLEFVQDTFVFVAFSPNNPRSKDYAQIITRGVQAMRKNGELHAILANYNVDDSYQFSAGIKP